jgi:hypothetical protein
MVTSLFKKCSNVQRKLFSHIIMVNDITELQRIGIRSAKITQEAFRYISSSSRILKDKLAEKFKFLWQFTEQPEPRRRSGFSSSHLTFHLLRPDLSTLTNNLWEREPDPLSSTLQHSNTNRPISRAMAQVVSHRSFTAEALVSPCEICGEKSALGQLFVQVNRFFLSVSSHRGFISCIIWGMKNRPAGGHSLEILHRHEV